MRALSDLKQYYQTDLLPDLKQLEQKRLEAVSKILWIIIPIAAVGVVLAIVVAMSADPRFVMHILIGVGFLAVMTTMWCAKSYKSDFKETIIRKIVLFLDDDLTYRPQHKISESIFTSSQIFQTGVDRYSGDDYVEGAIGKTDIKFSEVHAQYVTRDSKGRRSYHTIFKGLFFVADFHKNFQSKTFVLPDSAEKTFGKFGQMFQKMNVARPPLIKLEDPEFEKNFVVYGEDQIEARYILSTSLMKRIVDFKKKSGRKVHLSFVKENVFIAINYRRDLFEPRIFTTILDFAPIQQYYEDLSLAISVVEDLNLNTRIWQKQ